MRVDQVENEEEFPSRTLIRWKQYGDEEWRTERFWPYFYVDASEGYTAPDGVFAEIDRDPGVRAYDGTELHEVRLHSTRSAKKARQAAENHFEADIPYERRYYIDEVEGSLMADGDINQEHPHIVHLDIEVWADGGNIDPMDPRTPVISASAYSEKLDSHVDFLLKPSGWEADEPMTHDNGLEYIDPDWNDAKDGEVFLFDTERDLLSALARIIRRSGTEVLTGWNFSGFDAPYLIERMDFLDDVDPSELSPLGESYVSEWYTDEGNRQIKSVIKGIDIFDMMDAYKHLKRRDKPPNWRLETVAQYEGTEVEKIPFDTARVGPAWEDDPMRVMEYNRRDAVLTHHIGQSLNVFDLFLEMHRAFAMPLADTLKNSVLVEMYVMSRSPAWGITDRILDSKRTETNDFEGGNTKQPNEGLYEWVFSADVTSEYPNWVRAANLSPETVVTPGDDDWERDDLITTPEITDPPEGVEDPDHHDGDYLPVKFLPHEERLGILPRAVDEMFQMKEDKTEERAEHDYGTPAYEQADLERDTTKWFLNSIQGVTGMETHRLSKNEVSASITAFGRATVDKMVEVGESLTFEFVYGDTDSAFFHDPDDGLAFDLDSSVESVEQLAAETNDTLPEWARGAFGIRDERVEHLAVEPEKVAKRAFFPNVKKRYTLWLAWNDGEEVDKIDHTGWAIVRSDSSDVEERAQRKTLEALMHNRSESFITRKLAGEMERVVDGEYGPVEMARPQGSGRAFDTYGSNGGKTDFDGVPYFVAAMLSSNELLGTNYAGGDKAWMLPVEATHTVEVNGTKNDVNYLAIDEDTEIPDDMRINYTKVISNIIGKVDRVYDSLGWDKQALYDAKADALESVEVRRTQESNHTLGTFSS